MRFRAKGALTEIHTKVTAKSARLASASETITCAATTGQETTTHTQTAVENGHYGAYSGGAHQWASASWYYVVTCCANKMQRQKKKFD